MRKEAALVATTIFGFVVNPSISFSLLPNLDAIFKPLLKPNGNDVGLPEFEAELVNTISFTQRGKSADVDTQERVLSLVRRMETYAPPNPALLSDPDEAKILDGDWYLQYTQPSEIENGEQQPSSSDSDAFSGTLSSSEDDKWVAISGSEGESRIDTSNFNAEGTVNAAGITVDTSRNSAKQSFDIKNKKVTNEIMTPLGLVTVGGSFRRSENTSLRAVVAFETVKIATKLGPTLDLSFLFDIRAALKGTKESGWLETTYVSESMRIGRGNKGSLFVLTRDPGAVQS